MSKCLRCGAGNEWIEPVAKEAMTPPKPAPKRKRPKVRSGLSIGSYTEKGRPITTGAPIMSTARAKRPKVRYVARFVGFGPKGDYMVCHVDYGDTINSHVCDCDTLTSARRIASALNWHEAHKRGEL